MKIVVDIEVHASPEAVWDAWVSPGDITQWNFAIDTWCCPRAEIDLVEGGRFSYRMEARDGSMGFDFAGTFTRISRHECIHYALGDDRIVSIDFVRTATGVRVVEAFDAEDENSAEQQRQGWLAILENFRKHVEGKAKQAR